MIIDSHMTGEVSQSHSGSALWSERCLHSLSSEHKELEQLREELDQTRVVLDEERTINMNQLIRLLELRRKLTKEK